MTWILWNWYVLIGEMSIADGKTRYVSTFRIQLSSSQSKGALELFLVSPVYSESVATFSSLVALSIIYLCPQSWAIPHNGVGQTCSLALCDKSCLLCRHSKDFFRELYSQCLQTWILISLPCQVKSFCHLKHNHFMHIKAEGNFLLLWLRYWPHSLTS